MQLRVLSTASRKQVTSRVRPARRWPRCSSVRYNPVSFLIAPRPRRAGLSGLVTYLRGAVLSILLSLWLGACVTAYADINSIVIDATGKNAHDVLTADDLDRIRDKVQRARMGDLDRIYEYVVEQLRSQELDAGITEELVRATYIRWYPDAKLVVVANSGHYPMNEAPVVFATLMEDFLRG